MEAFLRMNTVGVYDAKTHLPKLLDRVSRGERFVITRHGRAIAQLVPAVDAAPESVKEVIEQMEAWQDRDGPVLGPGLTIWELREAGRR
jgi:prevent-host-death family protein